MLTMFLCSNCSHVMFPIVTYRLNPWPLKVALLDPNFSPNLVTMSMKPSSILGMIDGWPDSSRASRILSGQMWGNVFDDWWKVLRHVHWWKVIPLCMLIDESNAMCMIIGRKWCHVYVNWWEVISYVCWLVESDVMCMYIGGKLHVYADWWKVI